MRASEQIFPCCLIFLGYALRQSWVAQFNRIPFHYLIPVYYSFDFIFYEIRTYTRYYMIGFYAFIYFITMGLIIYRLNIFYQRKFIKKFNKIHKQNYEIHCFMSKNIFPSGHEHSKIIDGYCHKCNNIYVKFTCICIYISTNLGSLFFRLMMRYYGWKLRFEFCSFSSRCLVVRHCT